MVIYIAAYQYRYTSGGDVGLVGTILSVCCVVFNLEFLCIV